MKVCATCRERFDDELSFCTFDGSALSFASVRATTRLNTIAFDGQGASVRIAGAGGIRHQSEPQSEPRGGGRKLALFLVLMIALIGGAVAALRFMKTEEGRPHQQPTETVAQAQPVASEPEASPVKTRASLGELSGQELMDLLPKNLLRRFHVGESAQGTPDDLRVMSGEAADYVVLVGTGNVESQQRPSTARILILKYEEDQFHDVTRQSLPRRYAEGIITGQRAEVGFDDASVKLILSEPASLKSVVDECLRCEHAYQQVTLEWKGDRYVEAARSWENNRYTAFYVLADALEKRRVDMAARPFIEKSLDHVIAKGFARNGARGWAVEWRSDDDDAETADYELNNGLDRLIITVSKITDQWKVVQITDNR